MLTLVATDPAPESSKKRPRPDSALEDERLRKRQRAPTFKTLKFDFTSYLKEWDTRVFPQFSRFEFGQKYVISQKLSALKKKLLKVDEISALFKKVSAFEKFLETNIDQFTLERSINLMRKELSTVVHLRKQIDEILKK